MSKSTVPHGHFGSLAALHESISPMAAFGCKADEFEQAISQLWIECLLSPITVIQVIRS